jgi:hypothetical protein
MDAAKIEVGDLVAINGIIAGRVLDKFLSATGDEIYDIAVITKWGAGRIAVLGNDIAINYGPLDSQK